MCDEQQLPVVIMYCTHNSRIGKKSLIPRIVYSWSCTHSFLLWSKLLSLSGKTKVAHDLIDDYPWLKFWGICPTFLVGQESED